MSVGIGYAQATLTSSALTLQAVIALAQTKQAVQLAMNGTIPASMTGIVQPVVPRNVVITVTDGDTSISAFNIKVSGVDVTGKAVNETFVFAGGLVQTGTQIYASITSVTVNSETGAGAGDTLDFGYGTVLGTQTLPTGLRYILMDALTHGVTWTNDGSIPTATHGFLIQTSDPPYFYPGTDFSKLQFFALTSGAILNLNFFRA